MDNTRSIPVLQRFKISTPSVTVTVTADDSPLPEGAPVLASPGNLVTVSTPEQTVEVQTTTAGSLPPTPKANKVASDPHIVSQADHKNVHHYSNIESPASQPFPTPLVGQNLSFPPTSEYPFDGSMSMEAKHRRELGIRRWDTYRRMPNEDTPYYAGEVSVDVPGDAYVQGKYYSMLHEGGAKVIGPLPTLSYVSAPQFVRRRKGFWTKVAGNVCETCCAY